MNTPSVLYFVINLPSSEKRREQILAQGRQFGIEFRFVTAVSGKELTEEDMSHYDRAARKKSYPFDLSPNEIACVASHRKALAAFLESGADFGVIFEDDALLQPKFAEGIAWLTRKLHGWEVAKLYTDEGKLFSVGMDNIEGAPVRPVFPKKIMWVSVGYLYTREGARRVAEGMERFWLPADVQLAQVMLSRRIPVIGTDPGLVITGDPLHEFSDIDKDTTPRRMVVNPRRTLCQYLSYRLSVWGFSWGKIRMRRLLRRVLH